MCCRFIPLYWVRSGHSSRHSSERALDSADILRFLTETISWYGQTGEQQIVTEQSDLTFFQDNRRVATQVVRLAFDFARQQADAKAKAKAQAQIEAGTPSQYHR